MIKKVCIPLQRDFFIVLDLRLIFVDKGCRETTLIYCICTLRTSILIFLLCRNKSFRTFVA